MRKLWTIRPRRLGPDMHIEASELREAIGKFAHLMGVLVINADLKYDNHGTPYMECLLGNDSRWTVFGAVDVEFVKPA